MSNHFTSAIYCLALIALFHKIPTEPSALMREFQHNDVLIHDLTNDKPITNTLDKLTEFWPDENYSTA